MSVSSSNSCDVGHSTVGESPSSQRVGRPQVFDDDQLLRVALRTFAANGYEQASIRQINSELGLSHSAIQRRFGSKKELWLAAVDHGFARIWAAMPFTADGADPIGDDPTTALTDIFRTFLEASAEAPELVLLVNQEGASDSWRIDYLFDNHMRAMLEQLQNRLAQWQAAGRVRPITIRTLHLLLAHGAAAPFTLVGLSKQFDVMDGKLDVEAHIDTSVELLVNALVIS